jgi:hypothetical protein
MKDHFQIVKEYLIELGYDIKFQDPKEELLVISDESEGINNMALDCEKDILVIQQFIIDLQDPDVETYRALLQKNNEIVHGAFVLDESGKRLSFRDTLQLENLDINELEASINSLKMLFAEYFTELLSYAKA